MTTIREMAGRQRQLKLGTFLVEFATPGIGYILKQAGCDFVLFDLEHSGITLDQLKSALRYLEAANLPAIVGLPSKDPYQVSLALDMGARAIMSPMVETVGEVQQYLARARYAPVGQRAVALRVSHDKYKVRSLPDLLSETNAESSTSQNRDRASAENVMPSRMSASRAVSGPVDRRVHRVRRLRTIPACSGVDASSARQADGQGHRPLVAQ